MGHPQTLARTKDALDPLVVRTWGAAMLRPYTEKPKSQQDAAATNSIGRIGIVDSGGAWV